MGSGDGRATPARLRGLPSRLLSQLTAYADRLTGETWVNGNHLRLQLRQPADFGNGQLLELQLHL